MDITTNRAPVIKMLLTELGTALKTSVNKAIQIGQLLSEQKEEMDHGAFLPWLEMNFSMSRHTATNYMKLYEHKNKCENVSHLQDAYKQIEQIEKQTKQEQQKEDLKIIFEYKKSGVKPEGWERKHDYQYKKMLDDDEYEKRKAEEFSGKEQKKKDASEDLERSREELRMYQKMQEQSQEDADLKEQFKLSGRYENVDQDVMFASIDDYILGGSVSQQLEKAHNIIKFVKAIANKLQQQTISA